MSDLPLEVFVEEYSASIACRFIIPKICPNLVVNIHPFDSKHDLLKKLPYRLAGLRHIPGIRAMVLIDEDREDCFVIKQKIVDMAQAASLRIASVRSQHESTGEIFVRIVVEELESWFFGDVPALISAYPKLSPTLASKESYRNPDTIKGGTWEALERELKKIGYFTSGLRKAELAENVAPHMDPTRNRSPSFQAFRRALEAL